jgi:uncharacterized membrane protein/protein-disulfide isomerase
MSPRMRLAIVAFALLGLGASLGSSYVHYRLLRDPSYTSFCDVSSTINCEAVYESRFGTVMGVPVALGGVIWFAFILLLTLGARTTLPADTRSPASHADDSGANVRGYLFVLSTLALAVVMYLGYASFVILKTVCLLCLLTYVAVIAIFILSGSGQAVPMTTLPRRALADLRAVLARPLMLAVVVMFVVGAASAVAFFPREGDPLPIAQNPPAGAGTESKQSEFERWYTTQPRTPIAVPGDGAIVVILKFNDFQCPACGQTFLNYRPILEKYKAERPGAVKFIVKDFPLEPDCNPNVPNQVHQAACESAVAVRLAKTHNREEAMEEWLYTHQSTLTPAAVREAAREIGQVTDFDERYQSVLPAIRADADFAKQLGVRVTPTFFINGIRVEGGLRPEYFDAAIRYELQAADQAKTGGARPQ